MMKNYPQWTLHIRKILQNQFYFEETQLFVEERISCYFYTVSVVEVTKMLMKNTFNHNKSKLI